MKTPYDAAIRVRQREIEDMRLAINVQINQLVHVERSETQTRAAMEREALAGSFDPAFSSHAYLSRMHAQRSRLQSDRAAMEEQLVRLRSRAAIAYGSCRVMEVAAQDYRAEAERLIANAEQTMIDDRSAAALSRPSF